MFTDVRPENFRTKVPASATDTWEAWREGVHDDLALAVAIAARVGERGLRRLMRLRVGRVTG